MLRVQGRSEGPRAVVGPCVLPPSVSSPLFVFHWDHEVAVAVVVKRGAVDWKGKERELLDIQAYKRGEVRRLSVYSSASSVIPTLSKISNAH